MDREQFFGRLASLDEEHLQKALWNLYWRGSAAMRERIEAEVDPDERDRRQRRAEDSADPELVLGEVRGFIALARSGAYLAGDRRVSPTERTRWRFTFQRLVTEAQDALRAEDARAGETALAELIDLACEMRDCDYVRSDDPVEAARFVVSDAAALLWRKLLDRCGFPGFAERAAPQLIRWESRYGWTRRGFGRVSEKESSLACVLGQLLRIPDTWAVFADRYLDALDQVARDDLARPDRAQRSAGSVRELRTTALAEWHLLLLDRLAGAAADDRLGRLTSHPALGGPELKFLQARLAQQRGDVASARSLAHEGLRKVPGHAGLLDLASQIGASLPSRAQQIVAERAALASGSRAPAAQRASPPDTLRTRAESRLS